MSTPYYVDDHVTLFLGDCREITDWLTADVLVTDPPYGMAYDSGRVTGRTRPIANDADASVRNAVLDLWGQTGPAAVFGTWRVARPEATTQVLVWDKTDGTGPGMGDLGLAFGTSHEELYLIGRWGKRGVRQGSVLRTVGSSSALTTAVGHPTPKPVGLMERIIEAAPDGVIADPFAGSGSTLVAARNLGRRSIGVEVEERYCELIASRLQQQAFDFGGLT